MYNQVKLFNKAKITLAGEMVFDGEGVKLRAVGLNESARGSGHGGDWGNNSRVPAIGPSERTCPRLFARTVYSADTESAGPVIQHEYSGSINLGEAIKNDE